MSAAEPSWWGELYDADDQHLPLDTIPAAAPPPLPLPPGFRPDTSSEQAAD